MHPDNTQPMLSQPEYFARLQVLLQDSSYRYVVKQLATLAALRGETQAEEILTRAYTQLERAK